MSVFWRYVRIQLMVFVVGIVGPIFLLVYFAAQPDPTIKWMYYTGLLLTAGEILIALNVTEAISRHHPSTDATKGDTHELPLRD
ncbi:hypothetical protein [Mycolicibacterium smegmatis]|jgi:hypothetical protein|uniref:Probable membrane protein n=3 Tax=Mycolicibacterium smegmatis TaxID=1772 RepID=A0QY20_MYCS2|nr:hypothetical protein [Mycolicibacterium smegmatis]ABK76144.1 probable membrane protein [Mycolicibacterium smegmatis MC2 155]AIU08642.1 membrane protein [Mycolicibacterium smegmatis MC2 155]AIU15267.1 membrane protein [Mycolicibacterium smegmatis]AIU21890.1 membrane protein [Mycolicibacterium smegmatis]AWT54483.1 putative membrane protein [Mycolicibacterium smegmatis MKD8]